MQNICCFPPAASENKNAVPKQISSTRQTAEKTFPLELINYFNGEWRGAGKFAATGKDVFSDFSFVPDLENQCLVARQQERAPNTFQFIALWSVDSSSGNLVLLMTSNHNSGARLFRSENNGWQNDKIIFQSTAELKAPFAFERLTFARISNNSFAASYEISRDGKNWRTGDSQIFTRK